MRNDKKIRPIQITTPQAPAGLTQLWITKGDDFYQTDFATRAEFLSFVNMGPIEKDFCNRPGELKIDMDIYAEELKLVGMEADTREFNRAMTIMAKELPSR
jgi:hypothetical protein